MRKTLLLSLLLTLLGIAVCKAAGDNVLEFRTTATAKNADISVNDTDKTTTLTYYTSAENVVNPQAVTALADRIGGQGTADRFVFVLDPSMNSRQEAFSIGAEGGKILIRGNSISAMTTGLGWYLNRYARINISWNSLNEKADGEAYADLSGLPVPAKEETRTCDAAYRYFLNYCTFGYSMTTWTWKRWQQEIDWMALHGINMPLQIVGLEEVWRRFLTLEKNGGRKYNYTDSEAKEFVAGPAYTAWWGMNNLEGWGGTSSTGWGGVQDDAWYARQTSLAGKILDRQRELGMQPVLPGFSGMVPSNFTSKTGVPTDNNGGGWCGFTRPHIIDPTAGRFAEIAADYYECLKQVMGESRYYSMDPFHEGGSISSGKYAEAYTAIYDAMEAARQGAQWVIQQWQWSGNQKKSIGAVPAGRLIVLDLFSDGRPAFDAYNGYAPQDAVFCAIPNFGGRSGLMGRLNNLADNYFTYKNKYPSIKGIGAAPEAIEQTPVTYDLLFQLPWMGGKADIGEWTGQYAAARYGTDNAAVGQAWELLRQSVLNYGADGIQGPIEDVWAARPNLDATPASTWGKTITNAAGTYTVARRQMLADATFRLLGEHGNLALAPGSVQESNYNYDLVEFGGAVMADYAYDLLLGIKTAKEAAGTAFASDKTYKARRDAFLALIADMDRFKGTNLNFRLGKWTCEARDAAAEVQGAATATPEWYEFNNARTLITTWGDRTQNSGLKDYSYRSWQGLLKDYYLPRWQYFFDNGCKGCDYFFFEWNWAHGMKHKVGQTVKSTIRLTEGESGYSYSREPEGNTVEEAAALLDRYIIPVAMKSGTFYAYRHLDNDMSATVSIMAQPGETLDLTPYFGNLDTQAVSGDVIEAGSGGNGQARIRSDAADGAHTCRITLDDGTTLSFTVVVNPAYYGTYGINYKTGSGDAPVFVAWNEDTDNSLNKGYKMIATGKYSAGAEADKIFTIVPLGNGFSLSAQGKYLKSPTLNAWNHIMFSDNSSEAGAYLIEPTAEKDVFKIRSTGQGNCYINDYDNLVFGNDAASKPALSTFTITPVTAFPLAVSSAGMTPLCLPFNVVMPEGMYACDFTAADISEGTDGEPVCDMRVIAKPGQTLGSGTPVIIKADEGRYNLAITMSWQDARGALAGSLLRGGFVKQSLQQDAGATKYVFSVSGGQVAGFRRIQTSAIVAANRCWMEWGGADGQSGTQTITLRSGNDTAIGDITESPQHAGNGGTAEIYNLHGQRLAAPQKGLNIIGSRKVTVR